MANFMTHSHSTMQRLGMGPLGRVGRAVASTRPSFRFRFTPTAATTRFKLAPICSLWTWHKPPPQVKPPPLLDATSDDPDPLAYLRSDTQTFNAYLAAESHAAAHFFHKTHRRSLARTSASLAALLQVDRVAAPVPDLAHGWAYWTTTSPRGPIHWRKPWITSQPQSSKSPPGPPAHLPADHHELLLDPNTLPPGHALKKLALSPSHGLLGYLVEPHGQEFGTLHIQRLATPTSSSDPTLDAIPQGSVAALAGLPIMGFEFLSDTRIAYTLCDSTLRPSVVMVGDWREPARNHVKLVDDSGGVGFIDLGKTKDERYLTINASTLTSSEVHVYPMGDDEHAQLVLISPREEGHQYFVDHQGSQFYMLTNSGGAADFKVVTAPTATPSRAFWQDLIVPDAGDKLEDVDLFDGHLVLYMRRKGESVVQVHTIPPVSGSDGDGTGVYQVPVPRGSTVEPGVNLDASSPTVRMLLHQPYEYDATVDWHLHERKLNVRRRQLLPRNEFDPADYDLTRIYVSSSSSPTARIPVTLLHRRGLPLNASNPTLVRAYGAYGLPLDPTLRLDTLALVRSGWIVALAHVRGGGELGRAWHDAGRLENKVNSALDLADVAAYLAGESRLTNPRLLAAAGHSAGALAVAGAALMRPDLFAAMVLHAPFVDVLGSMRDDSLPLTRGEYDEWGDPRADAQVREAMRAYSPYELVLQRIREGKKVGAWPHLYVTAGLKDQRTPVWQTAKFVGAYRHLVDKETKVVMHVDEDGNHFGETERGQEGKVEAWAREVVFLKSVVTGEE